MEVEVEALVRMGEKERREKCSMDLVHSVELTQFKKHLLEQLGLSSKISDRYMLSVRTGECYMPLIRDSDLKEHVLLNVVQNSQLSFKVERFMFVKKSKEEDVVEFDATGHILKDDKQILTERPKYAIYPLEAPPELCFFCRRLSNEEDLRVKLGPVYGPIKVKSLEIFVHELCAVWTPEIYLDEKNKFRGLTKAIKRCKGIRCSLCKERGGGLGCMVAKCKQSFHYLCAKATDCFFLHEKFVIYCNDHADRVPQEDKEREEMREEEDERLASYICTLCKSGLDEGQILICDGCDKGFHSNCHQPQVDLALVKEEEQWLCASCSNHLDFVKPRTH